MALADLFSTDYGLLSLAVIAGVLIIGGFLLRMITRLINESPEA